MEEIKHIQFYDPLLSSKENQFRALFLAPGRYHGYDQIVPRSPETSGYYSVNIYHGDGTDFGAIKVTDTSNVQRAMGFLVSPHGVSISSTIASSSEGIPVDIPENAGEATTFFVLVASLTWADSNPGNSVLFDLEPWEPSNPDSPDLSEWEASVATDWAVGYFQVEPGVKDYSNLSYTPAPIPRFAWKSGISSDLLSRLARRDENNVFQGFNSFTVGEGYSYNPANQTLTIESTSSVARISYTNISSITSINWAAPDGSVLYLLMDQVIDGVFKASGGNLNIGYDVPITQGSTYIFYKTQGHFFILSAFNSLLSMVKNLYIPDPPSFGPWNQWTPVTPPEIFEIGGVNTFQFYWRTDGMEGYRIKVKFSVNTSISSATEITIGDSGSPLPQFLPDSSINYPIYGLLAGPLSGMGATPFVRISNNEVRVIFPGTAPGGFYTSPEITVSV